MRKYYKALQSQSLLLLRKNKYVSALRVLFIGTVVFELTTSFTLIEKKVPDQAPRDSVKAQMMVLSEQYLKNYYSDSLSLSQLGFERYEVPEYNDLVFQKRFKGLKSNIPLTYNKYVRDYINLYLIKKRYLAAKVIGRSYDYFPLFDKALKENGMPAELRNLAIVESALNANAVSVCGATGLWQFMGSTAKIYKLRVDTVVDERKDPQLATDAACRYLKDLYGIYKDWLLAIAAYNCGPGNVLKAIKKARRYNRHIDFWAIKKYLPTETQGYVPAFVASCYMMKHYKEHNIKAVSPFYLRQELKPLDLKYSISFEEISKRLNITPEELMFFNPGNEEKRAIMVQDTIVTINLPVSLHKQFFQHEQEIYQASLEKLNPTLAEEQRNKNMLR